MRTGPLIALIAFVVLVEAGVLFGLFATALSDCDDSSTRLQCSTGFTLIVPAAGWITPVLAGVIWYVTKVRRQDAKRKP